MSPHPRRAGATALVIDLPVPIVVYYGLRSTGVDLYLAVLAAVIAPGIGAVIGVVRRGRVEPLAALSLTGLAVAVALSLAGGGPRLLLAKEGWVTGITGVWFLVSARSSRPLALLLTDRSCPTPDGDSPPTGALCGSANHGFGGSGAPPASCGAWEPSPTR